jgi:hypothetical protein
MGAFRSKRVTVAQSDDLSFIGEGGVLGGPRTVDGSRFARRALTRFEYRFDG